MGAAGPWETVFWYLSLLLKAGLLGRLAWLRLLGVYPAISAFVALMTIRSLWLVQYSTMSIPYAFSYLFTEPLLILSAVLVVFELYGKILASYSGLSFLTQGTMAAGLAVSLGMSVAAHLPEFTSRGDLSIALKVLHVFESTTYVALLLFLAALAGFMFWFRMPVRRNVLVHCCAFASYFIVSGAMVYLRLLNVEEWGRISSSGRMAATDLIMAAWIVLITRSGEDQLQGLPRRLPPESEQRLLMQLERLNRALESKSGGRNR